MFVAMNQFQVDPNRTGEFEDVWRTRESHLNEYKGFVHFALLKGDEAGDYVSHTIWESRDAFMAWATSDGFKAAHAGRMPDGVIQGHPRARFYESVITQGGEVPTLQKR